MYFQILKSQNGDLFYCLYEPYLPSLLFFDENALGISFLHLSLKASMKIKRFEGPIKLFRSFLLIYVAVKVLEEITTIMVTLSD
jgi:hypothetical protein